MALIGRPMAHQKNGDVDHRQYDDNQLEALPLG
jgi:hypothetical protein